MISTIHFHDCNSFDICLHIAFIDLITLHGAETWDMGLGTGITLPQVLGGEDAKSWFKCFKVCVKANME